MPHPQAEVQTKFANSLTLKGVVQSVLEQEVLIKSFAIEAASKNHVTRSEVYRVFVQYSSKSTSADVFKAVAKVRPAKGKLAEEFSTSDAFEKELQMYQTVLPKLHELLNKVVKVELAPKLYFNLSSPTDVLFLEDLSHIGYSPESPFIGLNFDQAKFAIEKLAFFHAASAHTLVQSPELFETFSKGTFHQDYRQKLGFFADTLKYVSEHAADLGIKASSIDKLKKLPAAILNKAITIYNDDSLGFKVLNHGDFYTSNILFRYNKNGELQNCYFVDFQNAFVGSPVIDLIYFLTTSVATDVLSNRREELIYVYHDTLEVVLSTLGYKGRRITLQELHVELLRKGALEVIFTLTAAPFLRSASQKVVPALIPSLHNDEQTKDLRTVGLQLLRDNKEFLLQQLVRFEAYGLMDWGQVENKIKGLLGRFQSMHA